MTYRIGFIYALTLLLVACGSSDKKEFEYNGGTVRMCIDNEPSTRVPSEASDYYSAIVLRQITEGLVAINPKTTTIEPGIASEWTISDDGLTYTFTIRDNIYFHPHEVFVSKSSRKLKMSDIIYTIENGCKKEADGSSSSAYNFVFKGIVKGADDFFNGKADEISGVSATGNKLTITLVQRDENFLYKLASIQAAIISKKVYEQGHRADMIGTGPFMYLTEENNGALTFKLVKNPDYYQVDIDGNSLPYLDTVMFICQSRKLEQLDLFERKEIDMILGLPTSRITRMLDENYEAFNPENDEPPQLILNKNPLLVTNYYFFNMNEERFKDPLVRKAFNMAIDKQKIGDNIVRNQYEELGYFGIVPPVYSTFRGYDFESVKKYSYHYDPDEAKSLMAKAGYPNGEGFGTVTLRFNVGDVNSAVADEFSKQIGRVLGITVNIDGSTFESLNNDASTGQGDIFRLAWGADYPNPESFLNNFYGAHIPESPEIPSRINQSSYNNPKFDMYFKQAVQATRVSERMKLYAQAEVELMKDPPIIPLWYNADMQVYYSYLRNLNFNSLSIFDFKTVYRKDWTIDEYQESLLENKNN